MCQGELIGNAFTKSPMSPEWLYQWWKPGIGSAVRCDNWRLSLIHLSESLQIKEIDAYQSVLHILMSPFFIIRSVKWCLSSLSSNLSGNIFPLYDKYLSLIVVMKPKLKSWNYRQIVQWWLLVFWTESWKRYILLLDESFLTLTSSYLCLRTGFSAGRDSASVYIDPELGKIHAC